MRSEQITYRQAMTKLTEIVDRLRDSEDIDVDELVTDVARAKELITFCGTKVKKADAAIKSIVAELQTDEASTLAVVHCGATSRNGDGAKDIPSVT